MLVLAGAFVAGVALLENEPTLPDPMWCAWVPAASWLALMRVRTSPLMAAVAGYAWAACVAHVQMGAALPPEVEGRDIEITGTVRGLPDADPLRTRFDLDVRADSRAPGVRGRVRLSWYRASESPPPGSIWRMTVRLHRPHGWRNPGGFDYEGWLFANRIVATGYVKSARRIDSAPVLSLARVDASRAELGEWIRSALEGHGSEGLIRALAIGDRRGISERRWRTLRETGTAHLMAISGLHVGMAAGAAYWAALRAWTLVPNAALLLAAPHVAGLTAMFAATGYALLAGLALPTQRALLMLAVVFASRLSRRCILPSDALALALLAVVIVDPHSVRSPGFWLSFVAVAAILLVLATRPATDSRSFTGRFRTLVRVQLAVTVGLAPITLGVFAEQSLVSPLVNAVVIPLVGAIIVPMVLLGLLAGTVVPEGGAAVLTASAPGAGCDLAGHRADRRKRADAPRARHDRRMADCRRGGGCSDPVRAPRRNLPLARARLDAADAGGAAGADRRRRVSSDDARRGTRTLGGGGNRQARARLRHGSTVRYPTRRGRPCGAALSRATGPRSGRPRGAEPWRLGPRWRISASRGIGCRRLGSRERSSGGPTAGSSLHGPVTAGNGTASRSRCCTPSTAPPDSKTTTRA